MPKKKSTANHYFPNDKVIEMLEEYQQTTVTVNNAKGKPVPVQKDERLENDITKEILKVVKAIIQVYRYWIFEPYDDLVQHAMHACYTNYLKFDRSKGSAFDYFSIIAKRSLLNYTDRRKKHRNHSDVDEQLDLCAEPYKDFDKVLEELEHNLITIIDENYIGKKREKYIKIASIVIDYLGKTKKFVSKSDLYSWARSYGMRSVDVREFINEIRSKATFIDEVTYDEGDDDNDD